MGLKVKVGKLYLRDKDVMKAEVDAREIELPKAWEEMGIKERRDALRTDELKNMIVAKKLKEGSTIDKIKDIVPVSEELKAIMSEVNDRGRGT